MTAAARSFQLWPPLTVSPGRPPPGVLRRLPSVGCRPPGAKGPAPHPRDGNPRPPGAKGPAPHPRDGSPRPPGAKWPSPHPRDGEARGLVPPPAPRPLKIRRNPQSRPSSDTETSQNPTKPAVSSLLRHRDLSKSAEPRSLVPPPTPRPLKIRRTPQSRPSPDTETSPPGTFSPRGGGKSQSPCAKEAVSPTGDGVSIAPCPQSKKLLKKSFEKA